ncbi:hypothetical protein VW35_10635 [Devosia soli]|uniref:GDP-mannose pyrophosphatase n=1 Tax=Devosia soli TaxID=361041 RepID=A0A0F5L9N6_9HYPH|nr:NUDIX domain-containing protein [Devosia soli]KKB78919.1 hypothetical protein VW35_10635 [Devosia soli]
MEEKITLIKTEVLSASWGKLTRATLDYRREDGSVQRLVRENYDHGNAAALLLFNGDTRHVLLVRQYRYPVQANGDPAFLLEVCAGLLDGDDPLACARREALEETGHAPEDVAFVCDAYMSPGSVQEKVSLFLGRYGADTYRTAGGGLAEEGEELEVVELPLEEALAMVHRGEITDGKTIILLQHLALKLAGLAQ